MKLIAQLKAAWKRLNEPAPPTCKQCGATTQLAPGADFCVACSKPSPEELQRLHGQTPINPPPYAALRRRRDDPRQ